MTSSIGVALFVASRAAKAAVDAELAPLGIDTSGYGILEILAAGPKTQQELSAALSIDRTTTMRLVDKLEAATLVARQAHPRDRRAHSVVPTPKGRAALAQARAALDRAEERFLEPLDPADRESLARILRQLA